MNTNYNIERNSFLYGELNTQVKKNNYSGLETATTVTHVDNASNTIYVDAKIDIETLEKDIEKVEQSYEEFKIEKKQIEDTFEQAKQQMSEIIEDNKQTRKRVADVEKSLVDLDEKVTKELEATISQVKSDISKVKQEVEDDIQPKLEDLSNKINQLKIDVEDIIATEITKLKADVQEIIESKQEKLVSGSNIKTINGESILGGGNIQITSGEWGKITGNIDNQKDLKDRIDEKSSTSYVDNKVLEQKERVDNKCDYLYHDTEGVLDPDSKDAWYLMSSDKSPDKPLAGPYFLGGGGGGGSITEMTLDLTHVPGIISSTADECSITFNWTSVKGQSQKPTGNGTAYFYVNGQLKKTVGNMPQGDVTVDIIDIIKGSTFGDITITLRVSDAYSNIEQKVFTIKQVQIELRSSFTDANVILDSPVIYSCVPYGQDISKTIYFYVDGELKDKVEGWLGSGGQLTKSINIEEHGSHKLNVYFTCEIEGETIKSNELRYDLIIAKTGKTKPIITSNFYDTAQKQFISFTVPYRVYDPINNPTTVELFVDGEKYSELQVNQNQQHWEYKFTTYGIHELKIICREIEKVFNVNVKQSEIHIDPVTDSLVLYLDAAGRSNNEQEPQRSTWEYSYITTTGELKTISADLQNFTFAENHDGWVLDANQNTRLKIAGDARLVIPYKLFEDNQCRLTGKTVEIDFSTESVLDYETEIINCYEDYYIDDEGKTVEGSKIGIKFTAQEAIYKASQHSVSSQYKDNEHIRVSFTVDKMNENKLMLMYIDGIMCNAAIYSDNESFKQTKPRDIVIGSDLATVSIYCIRIYDNNLNYQQVVNNWIADTQDGNLKIDRFIRNDNFNSAGEIVAEKLPAKLPYIIWDVNPMPVDKKADAIKGQAYYTDPNNHDQDFHLPVKDGIPQGDYKVQGTSSSVYPVKNIRLKSKAGFINNNGETKLKYPLTPGAIENNYFTFKVDYASSEGANNVELVKLYNDASKEEGIYSPPQRLDSRVRVGIDGFPIAAFHRGTDKRDSFHTKANFNNDKSNPDTYGFMDGIPAEVILTSDTDISAYKTYYTRSEKSNYGPGYLVDSLGFLYTEVKSPVKSDLNIYYEVLSFGKDGDESWEITENNARIARFKEPLTEDNFSGGFEIRFPDIDGYSDVHRLMPMQNWVCSTDPETSTGNELDKPIQYTYKSVVRGENGSWAEKEITTPVYTHDTEEYRLSKFKAELPNWFNVDSTIFYYIFTHLFLMVDSRVKNAFPTYYVSRQPGDGGDRWMWLPYDMDTALGIDNEGVLSFSYNLEDTDKKPGASSDVFNGGDSVIWNNVRKMYEGEIFKMYSELRTDGRLINFESIEDRFSTHQGAWSENLFNVDSKLKYIDQLELGINYMNKLQGSKSGQRRWWLYNRFRYLDSKYQAGYASGSIISFREGHGAPEMQITPYADIYATVNFANSADALVQKKGKKDIPIILENPRPPETSDQEVWIYSGDQIKSLGKLYRFVPYDIDISQGIRLQDICLGSNEEGYVNDRLTGLAATTFKNNTLLKKVDVRNCIHLDGDLDLSTCSQIKEIYCDNTILSSVILPTAGNLEELYLPQTITSLKITNQPLLKHLHFQNIQDLKLKYLWLENVPDSLYDIYELLKNMNQDSEVRLVGFKKSVKTTAEIDAIYYQLDRMLGIDAQGKELPHAYAAGTIYIPEITDTEKQKYIERYPNIQIVADVLRCEVKFFSDGKQYGDTQIVVAGRPATRPYPDPTKESDNLHIYTFVGWDKDFSNVQSNMNITALYEESIRYFEIKFESNSTYRFDTKYISYYDDQGRRNKVPKPEAPHVPGATLDGWFTEPTFNNEWIFEYYYVDRDMTLYAKWSDESEPSVEVIRENFNTFSFTIKDNLNVKDYAITMSSEKPQEDEWIPITPATTEYRGSYIITHSGTYYVWGRDNIKTPINQSIVASAINTNIAEGTTVQVLEGTKVADNCALNGTQLTVLYELDSHYESGKLFFNDEEITTGYVFKILQDVSIRTISVPKLFTVQFEVGEYGVKPEDQIVQYGRYASQPDVEPVASRIITGWYTTPEYSQQTPDKLWDFGNNKVESDVVLYARWEVDETPNVITIYIDNAQTIECNYRQGEPNSVVVDWGDGSDTETSSLLIPTLSHRYTSGGQYDISLWCPIGDYNLGGGSSSKPVIKPADTIKNVSFANNTSTTNTSAFMNAVNLKRVTLSKYMTKVANSAFQGCTNLQSIDLPDRLISIGDDAFHNCTSFTGIFSIPKNVTSIGSNAFTGCSNIQLFSMPEELNFIGSGAFLGCSSLRRMEIPFGLLEVRDDTFRQCNSLKSVILSTSVEHLGTYVFANCENLTEVKLRNENITIGERCFSGCTKLLTVGPLNGGYNIEYAWKYKIPDSAFSCSGSAADATIVSVVLSDTITEIGDSAFSSQQYLTDINLPVGLVIIGDSAFRDCASLKTFIWTNAVEKQMRLGKSALQDCYGLDIVEIPANVNYIGFNAFYGTNILTLRIYSYSVIEKVNRWQDSWFRGYDYSSRITIHIPKPLSEGQYPALRYGPYWNYRAEGTPIGEGHIIEDL